MLEECIRCSAAPVVDEDGYCGHCHWAVRAEVEEGFYQLRRYLRSWARFSDWCEAHGPPSYELTRGRNSAGALRA